METRRDSNNHKIVIIIPIYKALLPPDEQLSLRQATMILGKYDITAIIPESFDREPVASRFPQIKFESFRDSDFQSLAAYNSLVLDESFYLRFKNYDYMLIYQLDAFVFKDELEEWCGRGYDYIGAPWIPTDEKYLGCSGKLSLRLKRLFRRCDGRHHHMTHLYGVGNGGFSLRKISKFIELTHHYREKIASELSSGDELYPEDLWLFFEPEGKYRLRKPGWKTALEFAFEQNPEMSYTINGNKLPFGCHAWTNPDYKEFWQKFIR